MPESNLYQEGEVNKAGSFIRDTSGELVILRLSSSFTNNAQIVPGQRVYFDGNAFFEDKLITGISIPQINSFISTGAEFDNYGSTGGALLIFFTVTFIEKVTERRLVNDFPCKRLFINFQDLYKGKYLRTEMKIDLQKSYVTCCAPGSINVPNQAIFFFFNYK